jgi:hypothetical protein
MDASSRSSNDTLSMSILGCLVCTATAGNRRFGFVSFIDASLIEINAWCFAVRWGYRNRTEVACVAYVTARIQEVWDTQVVATIQGSKLEKEREKEEVGRRYLSTRGFACTSIAQANTRPRYLRLRAKPWQLSRLHASAFVAVLITAILAVFAIVTIMLAVTVTIVVGSPCSSSTSSSSSKTLRPRELVPPAYHDPSDYCFSC